MEDFGTVAQIPRPALTRILAILILVLFTLSVDAQKLSTKDKKAIEHFEAASRFYRMGQIKEALTSYQAAIARDTTFLEALLEYGLMLGEQEQMEEGVAYLNRVIALDPDKYVITYFFLGRFQLDLADYKAARKSLEIYIEKEAEEQTNRKDQARRMLAKCDFALNSDMGSFEFRPINMGPGINSGFDEYYPCLTADDEFLLYTRHLRGDPRAMNGENEDFFISRKIDTTWSASMNMGPTVNSYWNEGAPTISVDGQLIIFTSCEYHSEYGPGRKGYGSCDLFYSQRSGSSWSKPQNLGPVINTSNWETQPSFSSDGKTLYFIRGIARNPTQRMADIYVTQITDTGWSEPEKLPDVINTPASEESVQIHPDGKTLYFSSNGHPGYGGLDIFMSQKDENGIWSKPLNLGYPINTSNNENSLTVNAKGEIGLFASNRAGGFGGLDLYKFAMPEDKRPGKVTFMKGKVFDAQTKQPLTAYFQLIDLKTGNPVVEAYSNKETGEFLVCLPPDRDYALNSTSQGYLFFSENFTLTVKENSDKPYLKDVPMTPIKEGATMVMKNIFFETNKYNLKPESEVELKKLLEFLEMYPKVEFEIGGHTDNTGSKALNVELSENRAKSVYDYLIEHKVSPERLSFKGYADTKPVATNETVQGRALNRRTEFKITRIRP